MASLHPGLRPLLPVLLASAMLPILGSPAPAAAATTRTPALRPLHISRMTQTFVAPGTVRTPLTAAPRARGATPATVAPRMTAPAAAAVTTIGPASTWQVTYTGFSAAAQTAFQRAVDIWSAAISSSVPVVVDAASIDLGNPSLLGQAGPDDFVPQSGTSRFVDPIALANAKNGTDLESGYPDIDAQFNSNSPYFCYRAGTDVPGCSVDFTTVVLHELGHGLGFLGTFDMVNGVGQYGFSDGAGGYRMAGSKRFVTPFDALTVLSNTSVGYQPMLSFTPGSAALTAALKGGDHERTGTSTYAPNNGSVYWDGALAKAAYQGRRPRMFAPAVWQPGSSYSHLSDSDFPPSGGNSLMTPTVGSEIVSQVGPVVLGMLGDLGYTLPVRPGSRFTPVPPVRLLDTRNDATVSRRGLAAGGVRDLDVRRSAAGSTVVPTNATAVVLNVTGVTASAATYVQAYPTPVSGTGRPTASTLNLRAHETRANLVTVAMPPSGLVRLRNASGSLAMVVDLAGYYSPNTSGQGFHGLAVPARLTDTRTTAKVGPGGVLHVDVTTTASGSSSGVPPTATAVVLALTGVHATTPTYLTAYPTPAGGTAFPVVSNVNVASAAATPNLAVVPVGDAGRVDVRNNAGSVDLLVDVTGYYDAAAGGQLFHAIAPDRLLDTRAGVGAPVGRLGANTSMPVVVSGRAGIPAAATSVILNVTGVSPTGGTFLSLTPAQQAAPTTSNVNLMPGQTAADLASVGLTSSPSGNLAWIYNNAGTTDVLADAAGWFGPN